jgi:hypothetical protein
MKNLQKMNFVQMHTFIFIRMNIHMDVRVCVCACVGARVYVCVCARAQNEQERMRKMPPLTISSIKLKNNVILLYYFIAINNKSFVQKLDLQLKHLDT